MSVAELTAALRSVLAALAEVHRCLLVAAAGSKDAATIASRTAHGTADPELARVPEIHTGVVEALRRTWSTIADAERRIGAYLASVEGPEPVRQAEPSAPRPPRSAPPSGVENKHGDRYPAEALPYCDDLPPRVRRGTRNVPIVGHVQINGRDFGTLTAHQSDGWTQEVTRRLAALDMANLSRVANHVEMKVVAVMVRNGATSGRVIVNHAPCGADQPPRGCHDYLPGFLPEGHTLTVLGTDAVGAPFEWTYEGKAPL